MDKFRFDISKLPTPCYLVDESLIEKNMQTMANIQDRTGCRILLAQKGFSMFYFYPLISKYLYGVTSSSLFEAKLGYEEMGKEVHIYAPAYKESEFDEIIKYCGHIVFNSFSQWEKFRSVIQKSGKNIECGIRINPEYSEIETDIYNPCFKNSRLGTTLANFDQMCIRDRYKII